MNTFFDVFFFGLNSKKSVSDYYKINKKWAGLNIFYELLSIVLGRFEYILPEGMDARFFELCLISEGKNGTIKEGSEYGNYKIGYGNPYSKYGYFNNVNLLDYMGKSHGTYIPDCPGNIQPDCVITYDNLYNIPPIFRIKWYAQRLTDIQGAISACIANTKGTTVIICTPEQKPAVERAWKNADDGVPVIVALNTGEGDMAPEPQVITNPQTGEILKILQELYDKNYADFLTEFGINAHGVINKLSGISSDELKQNDQARELNLNNALSMRKKGIDQMIKMWGVEASVDVVEPLKQPKPEENKEGEDYDENI